MLIHAALAVALSAWRHACDFTARQPLPVFHPGNDLIQAAVNNIILVSGRNVGVGTAVAVIMLEDLRVHGRDVAEPMDGCQPPNRMLSRRVLEYNAGSRNGTAFAPVTVEEHCQPMLPGVPDISTEFTEPSAVVGVHDGEGDHVRQIAPSFLIIP